MGVSRAAGVGDGLASTAASASADGPSTSRSTTAASRFTAGRSRCFASPNGLETGRLGIAATRKLGGAVVRNRAKRLVREVFRRNKLAPGFDIVIVPRRELLDTSLVALESEFRHILERSARRRALTTRRWRGQAPETAGVRVALVLLRGYKLFISPLFTGSCRFLPSCSDYAAEAIRTYGVRHRVLAGAEAPRRCHPFCAGGHDPVPPRN